MSDDDKNPAVPGEETGDETRGRPVPHRVIGTPSPAGVLLDDEDGADGKQPAVRELPADPADPDQAKKAERIVVACFLLATIAGIGFIAAYIGLRVHSIDAVLRSNLALGTSMAVAFLAMGAGAVVWVRNLMPRVELTEERHPMNSTREARQAFKQTFTEGAEASQFTKRPLVRRTLIAATLPLIAAPVVLLRDMGPLPGTSLRHTVWRKGTRLVVDSTNRPLTPAEFSSPGGMITVIPEGYQDNDVELAKATSIIIKLAPGELKLPPERMNWTVDGIVAYSKICTHVGCPVALYEQTTHHILCPCHQSTFDAATGATVLFGPAARPLPQLPIGTNSDGYLVALHDFYEPVGPSYWERG